MKTVFLIILLVLYNVFGYTQTPHAVPDVFQSIDSGKITTPVNWLSIRRPEIVRLFENNVYGQVPKAYDSLTYSITNQDGSALQGKALLKEIDITLWRKQTPVTVQLVLYLPLSAKVPPPLFMYLKPDNPDGRVSQQTALQPAQMLVDSGYAFAVFNVRDLAPDNEIHYMDGVLRLYPDQLTRPNGMKAISAWAWGASRVVDYLESENSVDVKAITLVGHGRVGETSLWAAATDIRFAKVISSCGSMAGSIRTVDVSLADPASKYMYAGNYHRFAGRPDSLPVDQHMLIAAIAPRPVYIVTASENLSFPPRAAFAAIRNAAPVYTLFKPIAEPVWDMPAPGKSLMAGPLVFRPSESIMKPGPVDWREFIFFVRSR